MYAVLDKSNVVFGKSGESLGEMGVSAVSLGRSRVLLGESGVVALGGLRVSLDMLGVSVVVGKSTKRFRTDGGIVCINLRSGVVIG